MFSYGITSLLRYTMPLKENFESISAETIEVTIWIAGDIKNLEHICKEYCTEKGLCVSITPTKFIYTGGCELGAAIGLINYPRFPSHLPDLMATAMELAEILARREFQSSCCIVGPEKTVWISRRTD